MDIQRKIRMLSLMTACSFAIAFVILAIVYFFVPDYWPFGTAVVGVMTVIGVFSRALQYGYSREARDEPHSGPLQKL